MRTVKAFLKKSTREIEDKTTSKILDNIDKNNIDNYAKSHNIKIEKIEETLTTLKVTSLNKNEVIFIDSLENLARSTYKRLELIMQCLDKNITIHFCKEGFFINDKNRYMVKVLRELYSLEKEYVNKKTEAAKKTRENKDINVGRKKGKFYGSMFDKHKKEIKKLHNLGVSNTRILREIGIKSTPQSLRSYIKTRKLSITESNKFNNTPENTIQTPFPFVTQRYKTKTDTKH